MGLESIAQVINLVKQPVLKCCVQFKPTEFFPLENNISRYIVRRLENYAMFKGHEEKKNSLHIHLPDTLDFFF